MNQSKLEVITGSWYKARENACERVTIGLNCTSDWMKKWREFFKPIMYVESAKPITFQHSNENLSKSILLLHVKEWAMSSVRPSNSGCTWIVKGEHEGSVRDAKTAIRLGSRPSGIDILCANSPLGREQRKRTVFAGYTYNWAWIWMLVNGILMWNSNEFYHSSTLN